MPPFVTAAGRSILTERTYLRLPIAGPLFIPLVYFPIVLLQHVADPGRIVSFWDDLFPPLMSGVAYVVTAVAFLWWSNDRTARELRLGWIAVPIVYTIMVVWQVFSWLVVYELAGVPHFESMSSAIIAWVGIALSTAVPYSVAVLGVDALAHYGAGSPPLSGWRRVSNDPPRVRRNALQS